MSPNSNRSEKAHTSECALLTLAHAASYPIEILVLELDTNGKTTNKRYQSGTVDTAICNRPDAGKR